MNCKSMGLLKVELFEVSDKFLYDMRHKQDFKQNIFKYLPEYVVNEKFNNLTIAEHYLQYAGFEPSDEKYLFFDLTPVDNFLAEDICQSGIDDIFDKVNFKEIFKHFKPNDEGDIHNFVIPQNYYLIIEIIYTGGYDPAIGDSDFEQSHEIIGYLDNKLNKVMFNNI